MTTPWNKGLSKLTDPSVRKISETLRSKKIDNFRRWREEAKEKGIIPASYPAFKRNGDLAELIGVILGDGNISEFPRTERLIISANSRNEGFIKRYSGLVGEIVKKSPTVSLAKDSNCTRISVYQKFLSKRFGIPAGSRKKLKFETPLWIRRSGDYSKRFIRGLFEAEGSLSIHLKSGTYNLAFTNTNPSLLTAVYDLLKRFEFHPERRYNAVRIRRKNEVEQFLRLICFREY